ncbi:MAG: hypothetical protein LUG99_12390 [Lachnospiraceae bacterium]|nr:hypothetical protein [Lachnospiraceae bacterium]
MADNLEMKQTIKDSVFTDLFGMPKYLLQLYKSLHPEDTTVQESDLQTVTLENIFTDDIYNDLGFLKGDKLVVMIEAQSTWTSNIIIRALEYLVNSYRRYFTENNMDLYKSRKVALPRPEIYVIYTGNRKKRPEEITLSQEFFEGKQSAVEVTVKMIYDGKKRDIVNQYITFTKVIDEQIKLYGRTKKAVQQAIQICKDADVLKEYLESRESEVVDIMMQLYDREEIMRVHDFNVARDAGIMNVVRALKDVGLSFSEIVEKIKVQFSLSPERAKEEVEEYWES